MSPDVFGLVSRMIGCNPGWAKGRRVKAAVALKARAGIPGVIGIGITADTAREKVWITVWVQVCSSPQTFCTLITESGRSKRTEKASIVTDMTTKNSIMVIPPTYAFVSAIPATKGLRVFFNWR